MVESSRTKQSPEKIPLNQKLNFSFLPLNHYHFFLKAGYMKRQNRPNFYKTKRWHK